MRLASIVVMGVVGATLAGCASTGSNGGAGTVNGALVGGRANATAAGALVGGVADQSIGRNLDGRERERAQQAEYQALEYGRPGSPIAWSGGREGYRGEVVPGPRYRVNASDCRDYTHRIWTAGEPQVARGTACRQEDGVWRPVN